MNKLGKFVSNLFFPKFKNSEELKKLKTKSIVFLVVGILIAVVCIILSELINNVVLELAVIPIILVATILVVIGFIKLITVHNETLRLKRVICSKCGTKYKFPTDVEYKLGQSRQSTSTNKGKIKRTTFQRVNYACTCSKCGNKTSFSRESNAKEETLNSLGVVLSSHDCDVEADVAYYFREE